MKHFTKVHYAVFGVMFTLTASVASLLIWCQFNGIQLQPTRLENPSGWREVGRGGSITFVGQFVLTKGESTDNGNLGVKLVDISWKPCPAHTLCLSTDAQATLRFYHPSDGSVICEPTLNASDTDRKSTRLNSSHVSES